jgi:transposase
MKKIREVIRLHIDRKASVRQIAAACNVGRTTAGEYVERAEAAGLTWAKASELSDEELWRLLFPEKMTGVSRRPLPDWNDVRAQLGRKGVTLKLLWQEYSAQSPGGYSYSRYARFYKDWLRSSDLRMIQGHKQGKRCLRTGRVKR